MSLPNDIIVLILKYSDYKILEHFRWVNKYFFEAIQKIIEIRLKLTNGFPRKCGHFHKTIKVPEIKNLSNPHLLSSTYPTKGDMLSFNKPLDDFDDNFVSADMGSLLNQIIQSNYMISTGINLLYIDKINPIIPKMFTCIDSVPIDYWNSLGGLETTLELDLSKYSEIIILNLTHANYLKNYVIYSKFETQVYNILIVMDSVYTVKNELEIWDLEDEMVNYNWNNIFVALQSDNHDKISKILSADNTEHNENYKENIVLYLKSMTLPSLTLPSILISIANKEKI